MTAEASASDESNTLIGLPTSAIANAQAWAIGMSSWAIETSRAEISIPGGYPLRPCDTRRGDEPDIDEEAGGGVPAAHVERSSDDV